jgi:hypothetical protein
VFTLPGQDPGQTDTVITVAADNRNFGLALLQFSVLRTPPAVTAAPTTWDFDYGVVLQLVFAVLLLSIIHVVASVPATGPVGAVTGAVFAAPVYLLVTLLLRPWPLAVLPPT